MITNDTVLLQDPLAKQNLILTEADRFLVDVLAKNSPIALIQSVHDHLANLTKSKPTVSTYIDSLRKAKLEKFADWIEQRQKSRKLFAEIWSN